MSERFEVLYNGKRLCVAGINGDGVLAVGLDLVTRPQQEPNCSLHIGGLGNYHPALNGQQHVSWPVPQSVYIGDEITIRILPGGDFDEPLEMRPSPSASLTDPDFGRIDYDITAWDGVCDFGHAPFARIRVHVCAAEDGPSSLQRGLFRGFRSRFPSLWPSIGHALLRCHGGIATMHELMERIEPVLSFNLYDDSGSVERCFRYQGDPASRAYFITLRDWDVVEVCSAD